MIIKAERREEEGKGTYIQISSSSAVVMLCPVRNRARFGIENVLVCPGQDSAISQPQIRLLEGLRSQLF